MRWTSRVLFGGLALLAPSGLRDGAGAARSTGSGAAELRVARALERQPLHFERRESQGPGSVRYVSRGRGYGVSVGSAEMVLSLEKGRKGSSLRVSLAGARTDAEVEGLEELPGKANYFIGNDPKKWRTNVPAYAKVRCRGVYPGIDLVYHGRERELEYDFVVAPGADPWPVRLRFEGARSLRVDGEGSLVIGLGTGELVKRAPRLYQEPGAGREVVTGRWVLHGDKEAGFVVGEYDRKRTLVIDPVLSYSTYLGGSDEDVGYAIAVDGSGSAYVTGYTRSIDFPTQGPYQPNQSGNDVFVTKFSPSGNSVVYSTYLGGSDDDTGFGVAVDGSGSAYVTGFTPSTDFPTLNAYQSDQLDEDAFVTKLSPSGDSLVYSTYLGGSGLDIAFAVAVDGSGSAYVTGSTNSADFPTQNAYQVGPVIFNEAFVTKLSPSGSGLVYSTYLCGDGGDIGSSLAVDAQGYAYVTGTTSSTNFPTQAPYQLDQPGEDAFVTKLAPSGSSLVYSTYLGGGGDDSGNAIGVDTLGSAYVTGSTLSVDFPTQGPFQVDQPGGDAFVTRLSTLGNSLVYSTYLGGNDTDIGHGIAVDGLGNAYVVGDTASTDFPVEHPFQLDQGQGDAFVTRISPTGDDLAYSTYLGGNSSDEGHGIAVDGVGSVYVVGATLSSDFPTRNPYQGAQPGFNVFAAKLDPPREFFTIPPCRLIDTRNAAGPQGGPALAAGMDRMFTLAGLCGIPAAAGGVAVNVTVTAPTAAGNLRLYPAGTPLPLVSSINYSAGQTRGNNAIVSLSASGAIAVRCTQASGSTHFILDVSGYFE